MAQQTKQQNALAYATLVAGLMAQMKALLTSVNAALATNTNQVYDTVLQTLPTFSFAAGGAAGLIDQTAGTGTIAVVSGSASVTFSTAQTNLSGSYIVVTGDASLGLYLVGSGAGTAWTLTTPYGGATDATAAWGTATPNTAHPIALPLGAPINVARNDLLTATGCLTNFQGFMAGAAVATQVNSPSKYADLLNS